MPVIASAAGAPNVVVVARLDPAVTVVGGATRAVGIGAAGPKGDQGPQGAQGPPGPTGGSAFIGTAAGALGGHRVVRGSRDTLSYASADDESHADDVQGLTLNAAGTGEAVTVQDSGEVTEPGWDWLPLEPVFLGLNGVLTQNPPPSAVFQLQIGFASTSTSVVLRIDTPIFFED